MKKVYIFLLVLFVLILFLLIVYVFNIARTPLITRIVKHDKNVLIYSVKNISPVQYCTGISGGYLQYKEDNRWVYVDSKDAARVDVLLCFPGVGRGRREFKISVGPLKRGEYRIEKVFYREEKEKNRIEYSLYIYFDI